MAQRPYSRVLAISAIASAGVLTALPASADVSVATASGNEVCKTTDIGQLCLTEKAGGYAASFSAFDVSDNSADFTLWTTDHGPVRDRGGFPVAPNAIHSHFFAVHGQGSAHLCLSFRSRRFPQMCTPELLGRAAQLAVLSSLSSSLSSLLLS